MNTSTLAILAAATCLLTHSARAQNYEISWYSIDGGGGVSTGGVYSVSGTIGQPDAGQLSGGPYTLTGGFWAVVEAIQTPGAPTLTIQRGTGSVVISWPVTSTTWTLQQNSDLTGMMWDLVQEMVQTVGDRYQVTIPMPMGNRYFRLMRQ